jgi:hypothetical protein
MTFGQGRHARCACVAPLSECAYCDSVRHVGVVLPMPECEQLAARLRAAGVQFIIEPHLRFKGEVGEQATLFFLDPCGNALEFKAFADPGRLFANEAAAPPSATRTTLRSPAAPRRDARSAASAGSRS